MKRYVRSSNHEPLYYIDGWKESRAYFQSIGRFTEDEWNRLESGETLIKDGKSFWIECYTDV